MLSSSSELSWYVDRLVKWQRWASLRLLGDRPTFFYGHLPRDGAQGVSGSTHDCKSDIRVLANAFRRFGWGAPLV